MKSTKKDNSKNQSKSNNSQQNDIIKSNSEHFKLYLQIIKLSSENQLLKNQIYQQKQEIDRLKQFEKAFNISIKATQSIIQEKRSDHKKIKNDKNIQEQVPIEKKSDYLGKDRWGQYNLIYSQYKHPTFQSLAVDTAPNQQSEHNNPVNYVKLKEYQYFGKLHLSQERQTIKSLYQSSESLNLYHMNNDIVQLPESHKKMKRQSQSFKWPTIKDQLVIKQVQDSSNLEQKQSQINAYSRQSSLQNRKTAYFKLNRCSSQQIVQSQKENIIQLPFRQLLSSIQQDLSVTKQYINDASSILSKMKCLPLSEYFQLLQMKRDFNINDKKVRLLQVQITQLKGFIDKYMKRSPYKKQI